MDIQNVNSAGNPTTPTAKTRSASANPGFKAETAPDPKQPEDSVSLSVKGQNLAQIGVRSAKSEQRKFLVTDDNDVVLKVIDSKTQKVVKSIPSEEQMDLKVAIRDGVGKIIE